MTTEAASPMGPGMEVPGREMRYREAFNKTLGDEMERDPDTILMGEDVAGGAGRKDDEGNYSLVQIGDTVANGTRLS